MPQGKQASTPTSCLELLRNHLGSAGLGRPCSSSAATCGKWSLSLGPASLDMCSFPPWLSHAFTASNVLKSPLRLRLHLARAPQNGLPEAPCMDSNPATHGLASLTLWSYGFTLCGASPLNLNAYKTSMCVRMAGSGIKMEPAATVPSWISVPLAFVS